MEELIKILRCLRQECPWDKKQTMETLRTLTIEETYELSEAVLNNNSEEIKEELGDLLLHILFYAEMATEKKQFTIDDVYETLRNKLIYRHPHIFGKVKVKNSEEVSANWETLKLQEKKKQNKVGGTLSGVPQGLPSIIKTSRIQHKAATVGFDWQEKSQVWEKIQEEIKEWETECKKGNQSRMEEEFGDILFALTNAARLYGIDPDCALEKTNRKFITRFNYIEQQTNKANKNLKDISLDEMEELWQEAKQYDSQY